LAQIEFQAFVAWPAIEELQFQLCLASTVHESYFTNQL